MKKILEKLLFIILFIPIFINARVNYEDSVSFANNYIYSFEEYRDYIYLNERIPYSLEETGNKENSDFKSGGFLSRREYEISNAKGNTYLSNGLQYWTLTKSSYLKHYIIDYKLAEQFDQNLSGVRITEYVKPNTSISGLGSYSDPWLFKEMYSIHINSNLESTGKISESNCSGSNPKSSIHLSLVEGESRAISICPADGYRILHNSCEKYIVPITGSSVDHIVSGLDKDNIICKITFAYITKGITLDACTVKDANNAVHNCTPSKATPSEFFVNTNTGYFFKDEDAQYQFGSNEKITNLPSMTGYNFEGYKTSNGTIVVNPDGTLQNGKSISSNTTLTPIMTAKTPTVTFDANGGTNLSKSSYEVTYNQKYSENGGLATVKKSGSEFLGWYTAKTGGTKINNTDLVKITSDTTLYAQWKTCEAGTKSDGVKCTNCQAGTYSTAGSNTCESCAAGTYSAAKAGSCTKCPAGEFNTGTGNTTCTKCNEGTYNTGTGNTTCTACDAGTYNNKKGSTTCTKCTAGTYNTGTGNTTCTACGAGTYSSAGATTCTQCEAGYYSASGASSCTACAAGTYNTAKGQSKCTSCPAGTYNNVKGSTSCTNCAAGKYNTGTGNTSCSDCPAGKYNTGTGNTTCTDCAAGTYSSAGASSCLKCAAGTYSAKGSSSCTQCIAGKYNTGTGNTTCKNCSPGTYNTGTGNTSCKQCEAGYYCTGGPNRQACSSGYTSNAGSDAASDCYVAYKCSSGTLTNNATYGWICTYGPSYGYVGQEWDDCADWDVVDEECDSCGDYGISYYKNISCYGSCSGCNDGVCGPPNDGCWGGSSGSAYCSCPVFGCIETCEDVYGCVGGYVDVDDYYCPDYKLSGSGSSMTCFSYATQ